MATETKHAACGHLESKHDPCSECWAEGRLCRLSDQGAPRKVARKKKGSKR